MAAAWPGPAQASPGSVGLAFCRSGARTVLARALARSPARILTPRNHGQSVWVFLSTLGGGLVDGDRLDICVDVADGAHALLGTQASTKIYPSPKGCVQTVEATVGPNGTLVSVPDPIVCFARARYHQEIRIELAEAASLVLLDGYTSGRSARGERWQFDDYESRTIVSRLGRRAVVDATRLDAAQRSIAARMGRYDAVLSLLVIGPRFAAVRDCLLRSGGRPSRGASPVVAASPIGDDGAIVRVLADRFETASGVLRPSFGALADILGDDPFARKW